jgi:hypothetical protein
MDTKDQKNQILKTLTEKAVVKQKVYDNTLETFDVLKKALLELTTDFNNSLKGSDKRVMLEYKDRGKFEAEIKVASDILIFSMHSNIFEFDREHQVWKNPYVQDNVLNSYCGIINIYNFLSDSFKYSRLDDLGYLVARIFVNREKHYFVEGKRQLGFLYNNFGTMVIDKESLKKVINTAILYAMQFDLLVPPYDTVKITSVALMNQKFENSKLQTGKRLGFQFNSDDVLEGG